MIGSFYECPINVILFMAVHGFWQSYLNNKGLNPSNGISPNLLCVKVFTNSDVLLLQRSDAFLE